VCAFPQRTVVEAELAAGVSIRDVSRQTGLSRSALSRHKAHAAPGVPHTGSDPLDEAFGLVERASSERERLRALESVRAALELQLRDFARTRAALKAPTAEQLTQLEANVRDAEAAYERVAGGSFDTAVRALQGLRSAVSALKTATAHQADDPVDVVFSTSDADAIATLTLSRAAFYDLHRIPERFRDDRFRVIVHMSLDGPAAGEIFEGDELVWKRQPPERRLAWADRPLLVTTTESANGNGHGET
jgi:hypothetical protein